MARPICARLDDVVQPIRAELESLRGGTGTTDGVSTIVPHATAASSYRSAVGANGAATADRMGSRAGRGGGGDGSGAPSQLGGWAQGLMNLAGWGAAPVPAALPPAPSQGGGGGGGSSGQWRAMIAAAPANDLVVVLDDWEAGGDGGKSDNEETVSVSSGELRTRKASPTGSLRPSMSHQQKNRRSNTPPLVVQRPSQLSTARSLRAATSGERVAPAPATERGSQGRSPPSPAFVAGSHSAGAAAPQPLPPPPHGSSRASVSVSGAGRQPGFGSGRLPTETGNGGPGSTRSRRKEDGGHSGGARPQVPQTPRDGSPSKQALLTSMQQQQSQLSWQAARVQSAGPGSGDARGGRQLTRTSRLAEGGR